MEKPMDDLISRQAAIDAIPKRIKGLGGESWMLTYRRSGYNDCVDACLDAIRQLPSAQPERKKGEWIPFLEEYHDMFKCSNCGNITRVPFKCSSPPYCYCPNCGADMREENTDD